MSFTRQASESLKAALLPFLVSRALVLGALGLARFLVTQVHASASARAAAHAGLLGWDAAWYRRIAVVGYTGAGRESLRFFPLFPLFARGLGDIPGVGVSAALLVISNVGALVALALIHRLVVIETGDADAAARAPWWLALFPAAFVLVMGYAESLLLCVALATFILMRTKRFGLAAAAALLAGLSRPAGLLLCVPVAIECVRGLAAADLRSKLSRVAAVLAAPAGAAIYLVWSKAQDGSFLLPLREQVSQKNRGGLADPLKTLFDDARDALHGQHLGTALHAPWALVLVLLAVVLFVRWPVAYGAYATVTLVVALTAPNLTSLERYGLGCFPFALAITTLTSIRPVRWSVFALSSAMLVAYALLAFLGAYVP